MKKEKTHASEEQSETYSGLKLMGATLVAAPYEKEVVAHLITGARKILEPFGCPIEEIHVNGALEIPAAIKARAQKNGHWNAQLQVPDHVYIALGCIIRGETYHFEIVANESARAIMDMTVQQGLVIGNGILTVENIDQAKARAAPLSKKGKIKGANKGVEAALAALSLLSVYQSNDLKKDK